MNLRRLPFQLFSISALSTWLLLASGHAQTIKPLSYNTTNFTVIGWTNTNAVTFTNPVKVPILLYNNGSIKEEGIFSSGYGAYLSWEEGGIYFGVVGSSTNVLAWDISTAAVTFGNPTLTRSNLFGAPGLSATITNGGLVFVFTNGILASTNAP
jgi:hypothetical protein